MSVHPSPDARSSREHQRLEQAHDDICTVLTILVSNLELVRIRLQRHADEATRVAVHSHLTDMEAAHERLHRVARDLVSCA